MKMLKGISGKISSKKIKFCLMIGLIHVDEKMRETCLKEK